MSDLTVSHGKRRAGHAREPTDQTLAPEDNHHHHFHQDADDSDSMKKELEPSQDADMAMQGPTASGSQASLPLHNRRDGPSRLDKVKEHLWAEVDPDQSNLPLAMYCVMTGFVDALSFTAASVWCGFQTGNTIELTLALARLINRFNSPGPQLRVLDRQALTSLLAFLAGAFLGRIGDRVGCKTRLWLALGTFAQALMLMGSAIALWKGHQGSIASFALDSAWAGAGGYVALSLASASMGLQGIMGKRVNTQFATTIVLTTVWCELMADPFLFRTRYVKSRDLKVVAVAALFVGGFAGRSLTERIGAAGAFGVACGIRVIISALWIWTPSKAAKK